jgi:hypothetical protein
MQLNSQRSLCLTALQARSCAVRFRTTGLIFATFTGFDAKSIEDLIAGPKAPGSFDSYDETIETEHQCPR